MTSRSRAYSTETTGMPPRHRLVRVALGVAMLILMIQLFCMAFHRHALSEQASDCVSCYSASQMVGSSGKPVLAVTMTAVVVVCQPLLIAVVRRAYSDLFLTPPSHAPPVIS